MSITSLIASGGALRRGSTGSAVRAVQLALRADGQEMVPDGDYGAITQAAVRRFQAAHRLPVDGQVGPLTAAALDATFNTALDAPTSLLHDTPLPSALGVAPWLSVMRAITGTRELPGAADSPIILSFAGAIAERFPAVAPGVRGYTHDSIPWCGLGAAYCLAKSGHEPPLQPLWALNYHDAWRNGMRLAGPALGAIAALRRDGGGHVTIYEGQDDNYWFGRGCNQADMVNVARFPLSRQPADWMWPKDFPLPAIGAVHRSFANAVAATES